MTDASHETLTAIWIALGLSKSTLGRADLSEGAFLPSAFHVTDLAAAAVGAASLAISELVEFGTGKQHRVHVDSRLASLWFGRSIKPIGWEMPPIWDSVAGDYRAEDGWIRLHTNAPLHRAAVLKVLDCAEDRTAVTHAVASWKADDLEAAVVEGGGCAGAMRSISTWETHPQGRSVALEPLIAFANMPSLKETHWRPCTPLPLSGLKVLDLTRVLAGPVATRFLAGYGAEVLRIDPPTWNEDAVIPEVTLGKSCARLDLQETRDRQVFERLLSAADVLVHGYRPGALDGLGYGEAQRRQIGPDLIDVSLSAYGWTGPWKGRRGFDSLLQMSAGIADAGMRWKKAERPSPLPVQALDHATGYLMAAAAIRGLIDRLKGRGAMTAGLSLARTAKLLIDAGEMTVSAQNWSGTVDADFSSATELTSWGPAKRLLPPAKIEQLPMSWKLAASRLGSAGACWID